MLRVEGALEDTGVANAVYFTEERQRLAAKLGASALDIPEIRNQVQIFDGVLHVRVPKDRLQLTALLHDAEQEVQRPIQASTPLRLWVK
jgi:hypothetical protein